ncbi:MAG: FHA domain-containing protein [Rectinema sp.]|nr:FHA domain-containing protein [Rectinema sp.]
MTFLWYGGVAVANLQQMPVGGSISIGRAPENQILIRRPSVARIHAQILHPRNDAWRVSHRAMRGTTLLNGVPVLGTMPLQRGDRIRIGDVDLLFAENEATEETSVWSLTPELQGRMQGDIADVLAMLGQWRKSGKVDFLREQGAVVVRVWLQEGSVIAWEAADQQECATHEAVLMYVAREAPRIRRFHLWERSTAPTAQSVRLDPPWSCVALAMDLARLMDERASVQHGA